MVCLNVNSSHALQAADEIISKSSVEPACLPESIAGSPTWKISVLGQIFLQCRDLKALEKMRLKKCRIWEKKVYAHGGGLQNCQRHCSPVTIDLNNSIALLNFHLLLLALSERGRSHLQAFCWATEAPCWRKQSALRLWLETPVKFYKGMRDGDSTTDV